MATRFLQSTGPVISEKVSAQDGDTSFPSTSRCDGSNDKLLQRILECLEKQSKSEEERAEKKRKEELESLRDMCSTFAAISVFMASLGATFLQYAQGAFSSRPAGTPDKRTDHVVNAFLLISVFLSVGTTFGLGYGAGVGTKLGQRATGLYAMNDLVTWRRKRTGKCNDNIHWDEHSQNAQDACPGSTSSRLAGTRDLVHRSEEMLNMSLMPLFYSVVALLVGLLVFVWAEQSRSVSISLTVALAIITQLMFIIVLGPDGEERHSGSGKETSNQSETAASV